MQAGAQRHDEWPRDVGVTGIGIRRARLDLLGQSPPPALARLTEWTAGLGQDDGIPVTTFPFREIVDHYGIFGRNYADPELVAALAELPGRLPEPATAAEQLLVDWLPSTYDQADGNYDSYLAAPMLERLAGALDGPGDGDTDAGLDTLLAVLLSDLLLAEGEALALAPDAHRQRVRTHAALQAFSRLGDLAPKAAGVGVAGTWTRRAVERDDPALATQARWFGQAMLHELPADARLAGEIALLPTTPMHDEVMFVRSVQLFELLYRQVVRALDRAAGALAGGELAAAADQLGEAAGRVERTPILYRVLTTMSREGFAVIRDHTHGRSAVQSRAYREIERTCAPRPPGPVDPNVPDVRLPGPSLQELYAELARGLCRYRLGPVAGAMSRLDEAWRSMKRTHWGITLKIIGRVPGTGGTGGASYLKVAADLPLFPELVADLGTTSQEARSA